MSATSRVAAQKAITPKPNRKPTDTALYEEFPLIPPYYTKRIYREKVPDLCQLFGAPPMIQLRNRS